MICTQDCLRRSELSTAYYDALSKTSYDYRAFVLPALYQRVAELMRRYYREDDLAAVSEADSDDMQF